MTTEIVPYEDFAPAQKQKAIEKDFASIGKDEQVVSKSRDNAQKSIMDMLNAICRQGQALRRICGREQVSFAFIQEAAPRLPWGKNVKTAWEIAAARVNFSRKFEGGAVKWSDIAPDARKMILQQAELLESAERGPANQAVAPIEPFARFRAGISRFKEDFIKCLNEKPLEERSQTQLVAFLDDTAWLAEARDKAEHLLGEK